MELSSSSFKTGDRSRIELAEGLLLSPHTFALIVWPVGDQASLIVGHPPQPILKGVDKEGSLIL